MEKLNRRICVKLTELLLGKSYNEKCTRDVKVCYSLENIIDDVEKVLILILLFGAFGKLLECFVCYVVICLTRVYMGGVHMRTWFGCTFMTVGIHACAVMCGSNIDIKRAWVWVFSIVLILMICVAPIPSPQRPDYTGRTRRKIKGKGIMGVLMSLVGYCVLDNFSNYILWVLLLEIIEMVCSEIFMLGYHVRSQGEHGECDVPVE